MARGEGSKGMCVVRMRVRIRWVARGGLGRASRQLARGTRQGCTFRAMHSSRLLSSTRISIGARTIDYKISPKQLSVFHVDVRFRARSCSYFPHGEARHEYDSELETSRVQRQEEQGMIVFQYHYISNKHPTFNLLCENIRSSCAKTKIINS